MLEFTKFLSHPWFTRAWTFQESRLARERQIHFGHETCRNQRMRLAIGILDILFDLASGRLISDIDSCADTNPEIAKVARITERADLMMDPMSPDGKSDHTRERAPLINLLNTRRGASCGRPQDVVFSLLGLVQPEDRITVDYEKPLSQLFYEIARRSLETSSDLEILAFPCAHSREMNTAGSEDTIHSALPWWVPNWSCPGDLPQRRIISNIYNCTGHKTKSVSFSLDGKQLLIDGLKLGHISSVTDLEGVNLHMLRDNIIRLCASRDTTGPAGWTSGLRFLRTYFAGMKVWRKGVDELHWGGDVWTEFCGALEVGDEGLTLWHKKTNTNYVIFTTDNGHFGRVAGSLVQQSDVAVILWGHRVPFILRKTRQNTYRVIAECYYDGVMDGQAILSEDHPQYEKYVCLQEKFVFD